MNRQALQTFTSRFPLPDLHQAPDDIRQIMPEILEKAGFDSAAITAFSGLSNRMANVISIRPNGAFFLMGRVPRK